MPAVEVKLVAMKGNTARGSEMMRPAREMAKVTRTREASACNVRRGEMSCSYAWGNTGRNAAHVRSAKVVAAEVRPAKVAAAEVSPTANMRASDMTATTDMASKVATAVAAAMSSVVLRHGRRRGD